MSRLLTNKAIQQTLADEFRRTQGREVPLEYFGASANDIAIANAEHSQTLKTVGEWIKLHGGLVLNKHIETLLHGEMPEEIKELEK